MFLEAVFSFSYQGTFNVNLKGSDDDCDTNSTDRDKMIKACDSEVA